MGIVHLMDRKLGALSGGELQRVAICATLLKEADVYFFDEATHTQVIGEGQSYTWTHSEENPMIGGWELIIGDAVDNENVNQETTALVSF